jgi:tetratricopeptide (TPR) repeat protein
LLIVTPFVLAAGSTSSADTEQHLVEYRAFREALAAGNDEAAASHARAAWQAAETTLGNHHTTAILAYNYGRLIVFYDTDNSLAPLRRVSELQASGTVDLSAAELQLYIDYAEFATGGFKQRQRKKLRRSLEAFEEGRAPSSPDAASIWLRLAASDIAAGQYRNALKSATRAEAAIVSTVPDGPRELAEAILFAGIARLVPYPRTVDDVQTAHNEFGRARRLFPPQKDVDTFDPMLARILAWDGAATAALKSLGEEDYPDHADTDTRGSAPLSKTFEYELDESIDCANVEWLERQAPKFPRAALRSGSIGAVFVGFRLGDDLAVRDARVLAEVPVAEFGESALSTMAQWRARELPAGGPACHENLVTRFTFAIEK